MILPGYYEYCCRVKTVAGHRALDKISPELARMNAKRPMVITDKGVAGAGLIKLVTSAIKSARGAKVSVGAVYDNVPPDSDLKMVQEVAKLYRAKNCDSIIAVGGGSVLDTAKGVNILVSLGGDSLMRYAGAGAVKKKLRPMIAVPTTSGTGSEMTLVAVIADHERSVKLPFVSYFLLPDVAVLDSRMTKTLPPALTASTGMDAMTHACEAYTCMAKNPVSDSNALEAIRLIAENILNVVKKPNDMEGRLALANASALAGMAFSNSMVGMVHMLGHARPGGSADVGSHVEALGRIDRAQRVHGAREQFHNLGPGGRFEQFKAGRVLVGHHHQVTAGVRVAVEHDESRFAARQDQVARSVGQIQCGAKDAAGHGFVILNVFHPPGRPELIHASPPVGEIRAGHASGRRAWF